MNRARISLNSAIRDNYAFFCPQSGLHLNVINPVGITDRVTPSIVRGLKGNTLLDLDLVIDVENGCFKAEDVNKAPLNNEVVSNVDGEADSKNTDSTDEVVEVETKEEDNKEQVAEEKPTKKRGNKKKDEE